MLIEIFLRLSIGEVLGSVGNFVSASTDDTSKPKNTPKNTPMETARPNDVFHRVNWNNPAPKRRTASTNAKRGDALQA
jgi:hypothetical protein